MAKWLLVQLAEGQLADGTPLITPATARAAEHARDADSDRRRRRRSCATCVRTSPATASASASRDYRGHKLLTHTGGLPGYVSKVAMIPDARLGIAILTNQESGVRVRGDRGSHHGRLSRRAGLGLDCRLPGDREARRAAARIVRADGRRVTRAAASKPSLPLEQYAGRTATPGTAT